MIIESIVVPVVCHKAEKGHKHSFKPAYISQHVKYGVTFPLISLDVQAHLESYADPHVVSFLVGHRFEFLYSEEIIHLDHCEHVKFD